MSLLSLQKPLSNPQVSFAAKTILVTGSNTGLGFEAAQKFTSLNAAKVILGVRDLTKGAAAKTLIEKNTQRDGVVEVWPLDMDSYPSIINFSKKAEALERLDIAVLNAGVYSVSHQLSKYGWEKTLQVNVLSTSLLALLLLPKLKSSVKSEDSKPVLEFVSSTNHQRVTQAQLTPSNILQAYNNAENYVASTQYALSKLLLMYTMQTLSSPPFTSSTSDVIVNAVCPGYCKSDLSRGHTGFLNGILRWLANKLILRTTEEGARTLVSGTLVGEKANGGFWKDDELQNLTPLLSGENGEEMRQKVWREIVEALRKDVHNIDDIAGKASG